MVQMEQAGLQGWPTIQQLNNESKWQAGAKGTTGWAVMRLSTFSRGSRQRNSSAIMNVKPLYPRSQPTPMRITLAQPQVTVSPSYTASTLYDACYRQPVMDLRMATVERRTLNPRPILAWVALARPRVNPKLVIPHPPWTTSATII